MKRSLRGFVFILISSGFFAVPDVFAVPTFTNIFSFPFTGSAGCDLNSKPLEGSDGALYGTTLELHRGMPNYPTGSGTIYKVNKDGTGYTVLRQFEEIYVPHPNALIESSDGELWGTTARNYGTIFKMNLDGSGFQTVHTFDYPPRGALLEASDGAIYGVIAGDDPGWIYKINKDGSGYTVIHHFTLSPLPASDGWTPTGSLIEGSDGLLYGTTGSGGITGKGTVFRLRKNGTGYAVLYSFTGGADGENPHAGVIQASDGALYGTTGGIGFQGHGSIYKINTDGTGFTVLKSSEPRISGCCKPIGSTDTNPPPPPTGLVLEDIIEGSDGALYASGLEKTEPVVFKIGKDGSGYTVLRDVFGFYAEANPLGLIEGSDGVLYGTTERGGDSGCGSVFKMNKNGTDYAVLRNFDAHGIRGIYPGSLLYGKDNLLYGSSGLGGSNTIGAIYKLNVDGSGLNIIYNSTGADDASPNIFIQGSEGLLYCESPGGTLFRINTNGGDFQVVHQFGNSDGNYASGLIEGPDGLLYGGTTGIWLPGPTNGPPGVFYPTLFRMNKDGSDFETFHTFPIPPYSVSGSIPPAGHSQFAFVSGTDGYIYGERNEMFELFRFQPGGTDFQTLIAAERPVVFFAAPSFFEGGDGALYGVWPASNCPTCGSSIARIDKNGGNLTFVHNFTGEVSGTYWPRIHEGPDGLIYGSAAPSKQGPGTIFSVAKDGSEFTPLFSFPLNLGFGLPAFIKGGPADLYGLTTAGGTDNIGMIYRVHVPIWAPELIAGSTWSSEVVLSWTSTDTRATAFSIERKTGTDTFAQIAVLGKDIRAFHDTNLVASTTYTYVIRATDGIEYSDYSNEAKVTTPSQEYFATFVSVARCDGFVAELSKKANVGSLAFPSSAGPAAIRAGDTSLNQQVKGILSFRTGELPDNATVISAKLLLKRGVMYGNPFASLGHCVVDVKSGSGFGTSPLLEPMDFQTIPGKRRVGILNALGDESGWYLAQLDEKANGYIDKKGSTQFRIYFEAADNGDLAPDYIGWYSGECPVTENRPLLEVIYR